MTPRRTRQMNFGMLNEGSRHEERRQCIIKREKTAVLACCVLYLVLNLATDFVPSAMACLASSEGSTKRTAV